MSIIDVCRKVARERNSRTVLRFAPKNKSSEQRVCRSSARTHTGTRTMLPDTLRRTLAYSFQQFHPAIPFAIRYAGFVLSRFTVRLEQNPIPIFARTFICIMFVHVWVNRYSLDSRSRSASSQTDEQIDQWLLVGTRCIVRRTPGGDETWFA